MNGQKTVSYEHLIVQGNKERILVILNHGRHLGIRSDAIEELSVLSANLNVFHVKVDSSNHSEMKEWLKMHGFSVWNDHYVEYRNIPDDALLHEQYSLELVEAFEAWKFSTGGWDSGNRRPVCAILDDGFDITHEDLFNNIFTNPDEIPNNGIDDDNNGYIDDYYGVNIRFPNQEHIVSEHGTNVMGVLGAEGNNGLGIAGITWNTLLLPVSGIRTEGDIIRAYDYLYKMRKKYNDTEGKEGAYIVVTNFSGGLENAFGEDHPIWCNMYDLLGSVGILSFSAVTNKNIDIDKIGDMPTTCTSPYIIKVTISDEHGKRTISGRSKTYVDLAAPGINILTTFSGDTYKNFSGTSASAPHVAGLACILYTLECELFYNMTLSNPDLAAFTIKNIILGSVKKESSFQDNTTTGGLVNMKNAISHFGSLCQENVGKLAIQSISTAGNEIIVEYITDEDSQHTASIFTLGGHKVREFPFIPVQFGQRIIRIPFLDLNTGIYIFSLRNGRKNEIASKKIFIR